jgi:signal transduction histidine kinase
MSPILLKLRPWLEPAVGVVFFTLWCVAEAGRQHGTASVFTLALISATIAISRVQPAAALIAVTGTIALQVAGALPAPESTTWPVYFGVLIVVFVVAHETSKRLSWIALLLGLPLSLAIAGLMVAPLPGQVPRWTSWVGQGASTTGTAVAFATLTVIALGLYAGAWAGGFALRVNLRELRAQMLLRTTAAQLDATEVELRMTRERDRIAREVHDVLAHSLAVVIAQADGARFISESKPEKSDDAFRAISDAARSALIDVRTLVEGLREDQGDEPQPGLADIDALLEQMIRAGMRIDAKHFGQQKTMTPAQQLAVYRIVQESLTNVLRHAGRSATTRLSFDWRGPGLALGITSSGVEMAGSAPSGNGIRGMKDRARLAGGWLTAGASDTDDEFMVTLFVPTGAEQPAAQDDAA